jgi:hypothetical protein
MLAILGRGRDQYGFTAIKAEFEAEGTRTDELLRMLELTRRAGLDVGLKIGGCEAIRDLYEARQFGVDYVVGPMIESPYALSKYIDAKNLAYSQDEQVDTQFLINLETAFAFEHLDELIRVGREPGGIDGLVFGRSDFVMSTGRSASHINDADITKACIDAAAACAQVNFDFVVGGGVSKDALPELFSIAGTHLSRFETRKVIFDARCLFEGDALRPPTDVEPGLLEAVHFEILWLMNKQDYYSRISQEDSDRIVMLTKRWDVLSGGAAI